MDGAHDDRGVREALHRVAAHVLGRARYTATGRFGLRATADGIGTPAFGDAEVLRLTATALLHERAGRTRVTPLAGATLRGLGDAAGVDLAGDFSVGDDTPPVGDPHAVLPLDPGSVGAFMEWWRIGATALDTVLVGPPAAADPSVVQLWPEHFDLACDVAWGPAEGERVNLGASPGDAGIAEPYLYVGPWTPDRPGDDAYWDAPFGATLRRSQLAAEPEREAVAFLRRGFALLTGDC